MKLLHVSDTHVGFANYARLTPGGLNQREQDIFDAFERAIDLALRERVEVVLHSGDLFDSVRPTNRALSHVLAQCRRLAEARIPLVVISGNHEAPRLRETGAVLRLLDFMPGAHAVYQGRYEKVRVGAAAKRGMDASADAPYDLAVHAVPHAADNDALRAQLARVEPDPEARFNVAMLHAGIVGVADFRSGEFHEQTVDQGQLPRGMDYVALGHYHRAVEVAPSVWYAGSTERLSFGEAHETKSANLVDLARGTITPIPLPTRPMLDLPRLSCQGMDDAAVAPALYAALASAPLEGAIARLRVDALPAHVYAALDFRRVKELTSAALHFELQPEILRREAQGGRTEAIGELAAEFEAFLADRPLTGSTRETLVATAKALLAGATQGGGR